MLPLAIEESQNSRVVYIYLYSPYCSTEYLGAASNRCMLSQSSRYDKI